jgi:hypothetical protein
MLIRRPIGEACRASAAAELAARQAIADHPREQPALAGA